MRLFLPLSACYPSHMDHMVLLLRRYVDEQDACLAEVLAGRGYARPKLWESAENAYSLEGIGPEDKYGVIKDVQVREPGVISCNILRWQLQVTHVLTFLSCLHRMISTMIRRHKPCLSYCKWLYHLHMYALLFTFFFSAAYDVARSPEQSMQRSIQTSSRLDGIQGPENIRPDQKAKMGM